MKNKYSVTTVWKYIMASEIDYAIDELENDPKFMKLVLKISKDKKMYQLCSKRVREDYSFVKSIIENFGNDIEFIFNAFTTFIKSRKLKDLVDLLNDFETLELTVSLSNLVPKNFLENDNIIGKSLMVKLITDIFSEFEEMVTNTPSPMLNNISLRDGKNSFNYYLTQYGCSNIIMDYLALSEIKNIFYKDKNFEKYMHEIIKDRDILKKVGTVSFLINYIEQIDPYLADYIKLNVSLLNDVLKDLNVVLSKWDEYDRRLTEQKFELLLELYEKEEYDNPPHTYESYIYYVANKVGMGQLYKDYITSYISKNFPEEDEVTFDILVAELNENDLNFEELSILRFFDKKIEELFGNYTIDEEKYDSYLSKKEPAKIMNFKTGTNVVNN